MARSSNTNETISCEAVKPFSEAYIKLSALHGINDGDLAKAMSKLKGVKKVTRKTLNNLRERRHPPQLLTLEGVAKWFKVPLWMMFIEGLPDEFLQNPHRDRLVKLIEDYMSCDDNGRAQTENAASLGVYTKRKKQ